jgi:ParB family chromosome partitioning protein
MLQKKNYKAFAYEPHPKVGNDHVLDITKVVGFIKGLEIDVAQNGLYDYVVLDSVINSVTSAEFEDYVLTVCNGMLKKDGTFFIGTRSIDKIEKTERSKSAVAKKRYVEFLDENNFSATFRNGVWTMQKFHSVETLRNTLLKYFAKVEMVRVSSQSSMHYAVCQEPKQFEIGRYQEALNVEFNMEYPNKYRHNKHEKLVSLLIDNLSKR